MGYFELPSAPSNLQLPKPVKIPNMLTQPIKYHPLELLKETLRYLKREDFSVPGIGASRKSGNLEGPEQVRFLLAEKIEEFLKDERE
jgi:hypothetical protein